MKVLIFFGAVLWFFLGWLWFYLWRWLRNNAVAIDQLGNAFLLGDEDDTISSRLGKCQRGDHGAVWFWVGYIPRLVVDLLLFIFDGWHHCLRSIENDRGGNAVFAVAYPVPFPRWGGRDAEQGS